MVSANLYVGKSLTLKEFKGLVQPALERKGLAISDSLCLRASHGPYSVLLALSGEGELVEKVKGALTELVDRDPHSSKRERLYMEDSFDELGPAVIVLGEYGDDATASKLFPNLASGELEKAVRLELQAQIAIRRILKRGY